MSVDHNTNTALVRRVIDEIWNGGDLGTADLLFAPTYVNHGGLITDLVGGPEAIKITVALYRTAFPDLHISVEDLIAEKDLIVLRWTARSQPPGELRRVGRTARPLAVTGSMLCRLAGGKIVESWTHWDTASVLHHVSVIAPEWQARQ